MQIYKNIDNAINKKTRLFDITNIYISLFCFYITQFAEYIFNGFLIGTLLFYLYNVIYFLWEKMAEYRVNFDTESQKNLQDVRSISETFLILKIFDYINKLSVTNILIKQVYFYSILISQLKALTSNYTFNNTKSVFNIFQYITQIINYKDIILTNLMLQIVISNSLNFNDVNSGIASTKFNFVTNFEDPTMLKELTEISTNNYRNLDSDLIKEYFSNTILNTVYSFDTEYYKQMHLIYNLLS